MIKNILVLIISIMIISGCNTNPESKEEKSDIQIEMEQYDIPGLAYGVMKNGEIVERDFLGVIKKDSDTKIEENMKFHIGSITKTMTALLAAISVENSEISWDNTISEILDPSNYSITERYENITLDQLLSHTGGVGTLHNTESWLSYYTTDEDTPTQRVRMINETFKLDLVNTPGEGYFYSNMGIVIAAAMLEEVTGKTWEVLMQERLLGPLEMNNTGFGLANKTDRNQPWGHNPNPVDPDYIYSNNPKGLAPAGDTYSTLEDMFKYATAWTNEGAPLISSETYNYMLTERSTNEGITWSVLNLDFGLALTHDGSNTMYYASLFIVPETNSAVISMTNSGKGKKFNPEFVNNLIIKYFVE